MKLYALHDKKAKAFSSFHVEKGDAVASRGFAEAVNSANSVLGKYPDDFELVSLCDVHDAYQGWPERILGDFEFRVVLTAAAVVAMSVQDGQLSLLKEA